MPRQAGKRALALEKLSDIEFVSEAVFERLRKLLEPISDSYLRSLIQSSGRPMAALVEGVHTSSKEQAERTLCALAAEYAGSGPPRQKQCRNLVIEAKDRVRWRLRRAAASGADTRACQEEILLWIYTWLENPGLFPEWVSLRQRRTTTAIRTIPP